MRSLGARLHLVRLLGVAAATATVSVGLFTASPVSAQQELPGMNALGAGPCISPPVDFNPLTASDAQLLSYGLPRRPDASSRGFAQWVTVVTHAKTRGCEEHAGSVSALPHTGREKAKLSDVQGYNWSGVENINETYNVAEGNWTVPCINYGQSPTNSDVGDWVGLGGEGSNLLQAGTYWDYVNRVWYSFYMEVGTGSHTPKIDEFHTLACGHNMYAQVDYNQTFSGDSYYLVEDLSDGNYWASFNNFAPATNTAEWIDEATTCNGNLDWRMMADFGDVFWTDGLSGTSYSTLQVINYWPRKGFYSSSDKNHSVMTAFAGALNSSGSGFTDVFQANGSSNC